MDKKNTAYEVILADTEESKKIHFKLRYQIYCVEKGYEDARNFLDEMEQDEYDAHAVHFLVRHKTSKQWIGTFRLILESLHKLPIHQHVKISILHTLKPQYKFAEFSRLSIIRQFQRLPGKARKDLEDSDIVFRAICVGIEYSRKHGVEVIIFLCRRALARVITRMGIKTWQTGAKTLHRGVRYPYQLDLTNFPGSLFATPKAMQAFQQNKVFAIYSQTTSFIAQSLAAVVAKHFNIVEANTPELVDKAYRLRHHAYGLKASFKTRQSISGSIGMDEYDRRSEYSLIQHRATGAYAATTRLILPDDDSPDSLFPIERHCQIARLDMVQSVPRSQLAEVSRFCVSKDFKRRRGERGTVSGVAEKGVQDTAADDNGRRTFPHITLILIGSLLRITAHYGITHWLAVMEPALIALLRQMGVNLTTIGPPTHYHGQCIPCIIEVHSLLADSGQFSQACRKVFMPA